MDTDDLNPNYDTVKGYNVADMLAYARRLVHHRICPEAVDEFAGIFRRHFLDGNAFLEERNPIDYAYWASNKEFPIGVAKLLAEERLRLLEQVLSEDQRIAQALHEKLRSVVYPRENYSDPSCILQLPFPYIDSTPTDRFVLQNGSFTYFGRERFAELDIAIKSLDYRNGGRRIYVRGNMGYGKSHIMAAMACLLMQDREKRVVYIPDCAAIYEKPLTTLRSALLMAFADRTDLCITIEMASSMNDIINFCRKYNECRLYFFLDQVNAFYLETTSTGTVGVLANRKGEVRDAIWEMSGSHYVIFSASGNYITGILDDLRQTHTKTITVSGGLTENEMKEWWERATLPLKFNLADKAAFQDFTGGVPLFLRPLLTLTLPPEVAGDHDQAMKYIYEKFFAAKDIEAVTKQVIQFARSRMSEKRKHEYLQNSRACLTESAVIDETILIDWRFFKVENGIGSATCGLARRSLAAYLKSVSHHNDFLTATWMDRLATSGGNPAMLGFLVEQTIISSLVVNGCPVSAVVEGFKELHGGWTDESFAGEAPVISKRRGTTIYIPMAYNYKAVDAIVVHQCAAPRTGKPKAFVVGLQVTIAGNHLKSELNFFEHWDDWARQLDAFDVEARFLWIREAGKLPSVQKKAAGTFRWDGKTIITPPFTLINSTVESINKDIGSALKWARRN
ncbi:hypothetical protein FN846DRAFT_909953 [Sphaerosporella brunnea]|uniref:Uncharacterized protein n=1 Tax=Sphaerosporella brunnea TaxID=1250544 RepID=A0A5J5ENM5_9PEZI|nr:hypothetical protein FN846DRAFT_909953 [Sphaerosporella brunnea]